MKAQVVAQHLEPSAKGLQTPGGHEVGIVPGQEGPLARKVAAARGDTNVRTGPKGVNHPSTSSTREIRTGNKARGISWRSKLKK